MNKYLIEKTRSNLLLLVLFLFSFSFVSSLPDDANSNIDFTYDGQKYDNNTAMVNSSEYWITDEGVMDNVADLDGLINSASWNRTGTDVILRHTGDLVGIGTTNPNGKLSVLRNNAPIAEFTSTAGDYAYITIDAPTGKDAQVLFDESTASRWTIGNDGTDDSFIFRSEVGYGGAFANRGVMRLDRLGNLWINQSLNVTRNISAENISAEFYHGQNMTLTGDFSLRDITSMRNLALTGTLASFGTADMDGTKWDIVGATGDLSISGKIDTSSNGNELADLTIKAGGTADFSAVNVVSLPDFTSDAMNPTIWNEDASKPFFLRNIGMGYQGNANNQYRIFSNGSVYLNSSNVTLSGNQIVEGNSSIKGNFSSASVQTTIINATNDITTNAMFRTDDGLAIIGVGSFVNDGVNDVRWTSTHFNTKYGLWVRYDWGGNRKYGIDAPKRYWMDFYVEGVSQGNFTSGGNLRVRNNIIGYSNISADELIKLEVMTLPVSSVNTNGTIGRNASGVYGSDGLTWTKLF